MSQQLWSFRLVRNILITVNSKYIKTKSADGNILECWSGGIIFLILYVGLRQCINWESKLLFVYQLGSLMIACISVLM